MLRAVRARPEDYDFIRKEVIRGAKKRHFDFSIRDPADLRFVEESLRLAISHGYFSSGLRVLPIVFMKNHSRVGMVMMAELSPGKGGNEIHLVCVDPKHQGRGYASQMLDFVLAQRLDLDVYARCTPASQHMYEMLVRRGFRYLYTSPEGQRVLRRPRQPVLAA